MQKAIITREEYVIKKKQQLDDWNAEITAFELKAAKAKADVQDKYRKSIITAKEKYQLGVEKLNSVKTATGLSWEGLKSETENVFEAFRSSIDQFKAHF